MTDPNDFPKKSEVDAFIDETKTPEEALDPEVEGENSDSAHKEEKEDKPEPHKNRKHRRLEEQLQAEREANIALNERVKVLSEVGRFKNEVGEDVEVPEKWLRIYGDTPEARLAWKLQKEVLAEEMASLKAETFKEIEERQVQESKQMQSEKDFIAEELESVEDQFEVDLTSDAPAARKARRELIEMVEKLSPKDSEGNIKEYADFAQAFEIYQNSREKNDSSRNKELGSRGMVKSGSSGQGLKAEDLEAQRFLRDNGII